MKNKKKKNSKKIPRFGIIIINIFYQLFIFILFILFIIVSIYITYKYGIKYAENVLYNIKLNDIYFDVNKERKFDYNFKINDYLYLDKEFNDDKKFKIIDIYIIDDISDYTFLKIVRGNNNDSNKFAIISVYLKNENIDRKNNIIKNQTNENEKYRIYKYHDPHKLIKQEQIEHCIYVSNKYYHIPYFMEYIYILRNEIPQEIAKEDEDIIKDFKKLHTDKNSFFTKGNILMKLISQVSKKVDKSKSNEFKNLIFNTLLNNYYNSSISNLKLKYKGSLKVNDLENENKIEKKIVFRGIYFTYNNEIYKNKYDIISKNINYDIDKKINNKQEKNDLLYAVINNSNQPNLLLILVKSCINISSLATNKKMVDLFIFLFPKLNTFIKEIIHIFVEDKNIYTSKKLNVEINDKETIHRLNKYKLMLIDFKVILFIMNNSIDDFLRLLYNNYEGICYFENDKLIYIKLKNKEEKKKIYNII